MSNGDLENLMFSTIERWTAGRYSERHGIVTSYDPKKHLGKVTFQPEGQESGWLPIETGHIGAGYGIATGLQPGDGKKTGDQVIVRYQEGDFESGKIVQRVHSDNDKPPEVQSGETIIWTRFKKSQGGPNSADGAQGGTGQQIYLKKDGTLTVTDGNGATIQWDGNGNIVVTCKKFTINASDDVTVNTKANAITKADKNIILTATDIGLHGSGNVEVQGDGNVGLDGGEVIVQGGGSVSGTSVSPPQGQSPIPPFQVP